MKLTIRAPELKLMSKAFGKIVTAKTSLPVLQNALFRASDADSPTASVTNLDETLTIRLAPDSLTDRMEPRAFLFPVSEIKRLAGLLKKDDIVVLQTGSGSSVWVNTMADGRTLTREIASVPVEDFPAITDSPEGKTADLGAFLNAYRTVLRAASSDSSRYVLTSAFWDHAAKALVATDGRRLQMIPVAGFPVDTDLIIPPVKLLGNGILEGENGTVAVTTKGNSSTLHLTCGNVTYQVRCVDANYPNYRQVIPSENSAWVAELQIHDLDLPAIRAACNQFTDAKNGAETVALFIDPSKIACLSTADISEGAQRPHLVLGRSTAKIEKPFLCCVNARYFLDGLDAGCSRIRFLDMFSPFRFDSAAGALYVLMPLRDVPAGVEQFVNENFNAAMNAATDKETTDVKTPTASNPTEEATTPAAESATAVATMPPEKPDTGKTNLQLVNGAIEPLDDLLTSITVAQEHVDQLQLTLRGLKQKARSVERHYRAKAKEIEAKAQIIQKFQKAVSLTTAA